MKKIKVSSLVRVKTIKELLKAGLVEEDPGLSSDLIDKYYNDTFIEYMFSVCGKLAFVTEVVGNTISLDDGLDDQQYNYYPSWVTLVDTKAAKILFKGNT